MSSPTPPTASNARAKSSATKVGGRGWVAMNGRRKDREKQRESAGSAAKNEEARQVENLPHGIPRQSYIIYFSLAVIGGLTDLLSKEFVFRNFGLPGQQATWWLIEDRLGIQTALN